MQVMRRYLDGLGSAPAHYVTVLGEAQDAAVQNSSAAGPRDLKRDSTRTHCDVVTGNSVPQLKETRSSTRKSKFAGVTFPT